jgi:hypothetical protein
VDSGVGVCCAQVVLAAVSQDGSALHCASSKLRHDPDIMLAAILQTSTPSLKGLPGSGLGSEPSRHSPQLPQLPQLRRRLPPEGAYVRGVRRPVSPNEGCRVQIFQPHVSR